MKAASDVTVGEAIQAGAIGKMPQEVRVGTAINAGPRVGDAINDAPKVGGVINTVHVGSAIKDKRNVRG